MLLKCSVFHCTIWYWNVLYFTALYGSEMFCISLHHPALYWGITCNMQVCICTELRLRMVKCWVNSLIHGMQRLTSLHTEAYSTPCRGSLHYIQKFTPLHAKVYFSPCRGLLLSMQRFHLTPFKGLLHIRWLHSMYRFTHSMQRFHFTPRGRYWPWAGAVGAGGDSLWEEYGCRKPPKSLGQYTNWTAL